jgi:hypothetical protein
MEDVYASIALTVPAAGVSAVMHFAEGYLLLGAFSIMSSAIVLKAGLGFVLVAGQDDAVWLGMSRIIWRVFPKAIQDHRHKALRIGTDVGQPVW